MDYFEGYRDNQAFIYFSEEIMVLLAEILEISFDGTFILFPNNFTSCGQYLLLLISTSFQLQSFNW